MTQVRPNGKPNSAAAALAPEPIPLWVKVAICAALIGLMSAVRLGWWGHRVMPIAFGMPLLVFVWIRDRRLLWVTVAIFGATTVFKYFLFAPVMDERGV